MHNTRIRNAGSPPSLKLRTGNAGVTTVHPFGYDEASRWPDRDYAYLLRLDTAPSRSVGLGTASPFRSAERNMFRHSIPDAKRAGASLPRNK